MNCFLFVHEYYVFVGDCSTIIVMLEEMLYMILLWNKPLWQVVNENACTMFKGLACRSCFVQAI